MSFGVPHLQWSHLCVHIYCSLSERREAVLRLRLFLKVLSIITETPSYDINMIQEIQSLSMSLSDIQLRGCFRNALTPLFSKIKGQLLGKTTLLMQYLLLYNEASLARGRSMKRCSVLFRTGKSTVLNRWIAGHPHTQLSSIRDHQVAPV